MFTVALFIIAKIWKQPKWPLTDKWIKNKCVWILLSHVWLFATPMDLPGSTVHGIFQERILQWVALSYSRGSSRPRDWTHVSRIGRQILYCCASWASHIHKNINIYSMYVISRSGMSDTLVPPQTAAYQAPLSLGFSRQEYWSLLPFPTPGDLPSQRIKPASSALAGGFFTTGLPWWFRQ